MHDIEFIRNNPAEFDEALKKRGIEPLSSKILELDLDLRKAKTDLQLLLEQKNKIAKEIGIRKSKKEDADDLLKEADDIKNQISLIEGKVNGQNELQSVLETIPNILDDNVPFGKDEGDNVEIRKWGKIREFKNKPKEHFEIGETLGLMDFESASKISGSRFVVLKGKIARLERALANFMLDIHEKNGYTEIIPPLLVKDEAMYGTGQLPKFGEDSFKTNTGHWLTATSEISLTNLVRETILNESELPIRMTAYTQCFRSEAGSAGRDTRGMIRQHQFSKVEMVSITKLEDSETEHERMTACAEEILQKLGLPYRVMLLSSGDTGFGAKKTYDIEVWLPGQNTYREISSCSNCGNFQARRMNARYKNDGDKKNKFVATLNGSGLPLGRTIVAIIENYQNEEGTDFDLPDVLIPYTKSRL